MAEFDYAGTVSAIEETLARVENPETGVEEAEKLIAQARKQLERCYDYLRSEREKL